ncbi:MAG: hypothetical protein H7249_04045 [Chitinophagaceae bacterium]|nr:hypothetical protein [Oligoflexus sp.]
MRDLIVDGSYVHPQRRFQISIEDTGGGIDAGEAKKIFRLSISLLPITVNRLPFYIGMQIDSTEMIPAKRTLKNSYCNNALSQRLCDRINNALMKIQAIIPIYDGGTTFDRMLEASFETILQTVQSIHNYRSNYLQIAAGTSSAGDIGATSGGISQTPPTVS